MTRVRILYRASKNAKKIDMRKNGKKKQSWLLLLLTSTTPHIYSPVVVNLFPLRASLFIGNPPTSRSPQIPHQTLSIYRSIPSYTSSSIEVGPSTDSWRPPPVAASHPLPHSRAPGPNKNSPPSTPTASSSLHPPPPLAYTSTTTPPSKASCPHPPPRGQQRLHLTLRPRQSRPRSA